jgi:hypothetical protein
MARLAKVAADGIENGEIDARVDAKALGQLIISTLEGALLISRLENDREALDRVRHHLCDYLEANVRRGKRAGSTRRTRRSLQAGA